MKNTALITILAAAAVASAQVTLDNGTYTCAKPNVAYCAGDSMKTDIIVRCDSKGKGQPGRCSDNLAGEPPMGVQPALCYQSDSSTGDAACEKNCVVYGGSGNGNGTFTLPADQCTPTFTASPTGTSPTGGSPTGGSNTSCEPCEGGTGSPTTVTTTVCETSSEEVPPATGVSPTTEVPTAPTGAAPTTPAGPGGPETTPGAPTANNTAPGSPGYPTYPPTNATAPPTTPTAITTAPPATQTPTGPTTIPTAGAAVNAAGGILAALGLAVAYIL